MTNAGVPPPRGYAKPCNRLPKQGKLRLGNFGAPCMPLASSRCLTPAPRKQAGISGGTICKRCNKKALLTCRWP